MPEDTSAPRYLLRLFIAGDSPHARAALHNLQRICESQFPDQYRIEVVDLMHEPHRGDEEGVIATPALNKELPPPVRRVIGDLSDREQVLNGLQLIPEAKDGMP
ncbi:MAG: circadian clock protein KaiB [Halorhodospira halophila]|uniref:circadian clock KaiB family protein n=1 Tax=Halorhodospira halophila TaxID=1053 RepID=UPI0026EAD00E|nr:circadian clock KaiB family protein [Halorhodospira halophila]MCC3751365.1 circadian clock protein KaiB [Halorhodospira halophila]